MVLLGVLNEYSSSDINTLMEFNEILYTVSPSVYSYLLEKGCKVDMAYLITKKSIFVSNIGEFIGKSVYIPEKYRYKDIYSEYISHFTTYYIEDFI